MADELNRTLEMQVEADAAGAEQQLEALVERLRSVQTVLRRMSDKRKDEFLPGVKASLTELERLRKKASNIRIKIAGEKEGTKPFERYNAQLAEIQKQMETASASAMAELSKTQAFFDSRNAKPTEIKVDTSNIEQATEELDTATAKARKLEQATKPRKLCEYQGGMASQQVEELERLQADSTKTIDIRIEGVEDLASASKTLDSLIATSTRLNAELIKAQAAGDAKGAERLQARITATEKAVDAYADAVARFDAEGAVFHDVLASLDVGTPEGVQRLTAELGRLERQLTAAESAKRAFAAQGDATGVTKATIAVERLSAALHTYYNIVDTPQAQRGLQIQALTADMERASATVEAVQGKIRSSAAGGTQAFSKLSAAARKLRMELTEARIAQEQATRALNSVELSGMARVSANAKSLARSAGLAAQRLYQTRTNARLLDKEGKKLNATFLRFSRIVTMMAIRSAIRSVIRLTQEGVQNLAKFSAAADNRFNGALSRMKSSLTQLKNSFATALAPIVQIVASAIASAMDKISAFLTNVGRLLAAVFGQTSFVKATASAEDYAKGLDKASGSAKKLKNTLAGFDKFNLLGERDSGGGAGYEGGFETEDISAETSKFKKLREATEHLKTSLTTTFSGVWEDLKQGFDDFIRDVFSIPSGQSVIDWIAEKLDGLATWIDQHPDLAKSLTKSFIVLGAAMMAGVSGPFAAVAAGLYLLMDIFSETSAFVDALKTAFSGLVDFVGGAFTGDWTRAMNGFYNIAAGVINGIITIVETLAKSLASLLDLFGTAIGKDWGLADKVSLPRLGARKYDEGNGYWYGGGITGTPNTSFMATGTAVLDNGRTSGGSIANADTIKQAVADGLKTALAEQPVEVQTTINNRMTLDGKVVYDSVVREDAKQAKRTGRGGFKS